MYKIDKVQLPAAGVCAEPFDEYMNIAKHEYHIAKHEYHIAKHEYHIAKHEYHIAKHEYHIAKHEYHIAKHEYHIAKHEYHIASCVIDFEILYIRSNYFLCTAGASYVRHTSSSYVVGS